MDTQTELYDHTEREPMTSLDLGKPQIICVIGGPGVGKGTQCKRLAEAFNAVHISVGDLFRAQAEKLLAEQGVDIKTLMSNAALAPMDVTQKMLADYLSQHVKTGRTLFLVDGFPRTLEQALLFRDSGYEVKAVLYFKSSRELMFSRLMNRAQTSGRVDDTPAVFKKRYEGFVEEITRIADWYGQQKKLHIVNCERPLENVYELVVEQVKVLFGMAAPSLAFVYE